MAADPQSNEFESHFVEMQEQLGCPACYGALRLVELQVICSVCGRAYPIVNGIPILIAEQGQSQEER